jgi:thiol-disulfide isomerase/thioredoxin
LAIVNRARIRLFGSLLCIACSVPALAVDDPPGNAPPAGNAEPLPDTDPFPDRPKAPPLDGGISWLNSAGPIELSKLKGKIVLLDFWTYCCINCMHILPDLAQLEAEFPNELVVIGVHSAKFEGEQDTQNIRDAIMRYDIKHPVINDGNMAIWRRYGVNSWPTQVLIDPKGRYIGNVSGEGNYQIVRDVIGTLIKYHDKKGTLDRRPIHFTLESFSRPSTPLLYPGKLLVDEPSHRLFIADSGHHRIVIADSTTGQVMDVIGTGRPGWQDGSYDQVLFHEPQGMAITGQTLYIADRKNHLIRAVDLSSRTVTTVAGTGTQGHERIATGPAQQIPLASPWDLLINKDQLFIAMAGTHQIWRLDLTSSIVSPYAGSGRENILDGPPALANFAQPSGLAASPTHLYVADSETSSIRAIRWDDASVATIVGKGLFDFGDADGKPSKARLQHALGVDVAGNQLFVADTYNNKIKTILLETQQTQTFAGDGKGELSDDPARFDEPSDIQVVGSELYVADTNNHAIRIIDIASKKVRTLELTNLQPPPIPSEDPPTASPPKDSPAVTLASNKAITLHAKVPVAENEKLNPKAPMSYSIDRETAPGQRTRIAKGRFDKIDSAVTMNIDSRELTGAAALIVSITYFPCDTASEGLCRISTQSWKIPFTLDEAGMDHVELVP